MLLQIKAIKYPMTRCNCRDLGFILHKNPDNFQNVDLKFGKAYIFYTDATENIAVCNLVLDIDSLELSKGNYGYSGTGLFDYVNDGAFCTNSFMASAIKKVFSTAMSGVCKDRPDLEEKIPWEQTTVSLYGVKTSDKWIEKYFDGIKERYSISYKYCATSEYVDDKFEEFGPNSYKNIDITFKFCLYKDIKFMNILSIVYIFIMTCVWKSHAYMNGPDEFEKVRRYTEDWIDVHPYRNNILNRYFSGIENYYRDYLDKYYPRTDKQLKEIEEERAARPASLSQHRKEWISGTIGRILKKYGVTEIETVTELGCAEGKQIWNLIEDPSLNIKFFKGLDIDTNAISKANRNLKKFDNYEIYHGSALYRDDRLLDSDIVMAIEVIEHIDKDKLDVFLDNVFKYIRPKFFIMTTPNKDYNKFYNIAPGRLRYNDHRFEFTEKEFAEFVRSIPVKYPEYTYETKLGMDRIWIGIGEIKDDIYPTFGTLLIRRDMLDA